MKIFLGVCLLLLGSITPLAGNGIQAVIFDWAGTIQDHGSLAPAASFRKVFEEKGIQVTEEEIRQFMGLEKREHIGKMLQLPSVQKQWEELYAKKPTEDDLDALYWAFVPAQMKCLEDYAQLIPGMADTASWIRGQGWRIGSTTGYSGKMLEVVAQAVRKQGFETDVAVSSDQVKAGRPDPAMLEAVCQKFSIDDPKCVVNVDDSIPGILAGDRAGCWNIYVYQTGNGVGKSQKELEDLPKKEREVLLAEAKAKGIGVAHYCIPSVAELPEYLETIETLVKQGYSPKNFNKDNPPPEPKPHVAMHDELLLTPGPLTTSDTVKQAMQKDFGSRDERFLAMNSRVMQRLASLVDSTGDYVAVPLQGSGTFAVEAMLGSLLSKDDKLLILINGAYGSRMEKICKTIGKKCIALRFSENEIVTTESLEKTLQNDASITHVAMVHCETTSGILNPLEKIAQVCKKYEKRLFVDAMSSFGGVPIDTETAPFDAIAASSNKCLEGVPGLSFVIAKEELIKEAKGNSHSLALDLNDQWETLVKTRQWRFTPPTQVIAALSQALDELDREGGVVARNQRYQENASLLRKQFIRVGMKPFISEEVQSPIILTFYLPEESSFSFDKFYKKLSKKGFIIYPGKVTEAKTFRVGCIGQIYPLDTWAFHRAVVDTLIDFRRKSAIELLR